MGSPQAVDSDGVTLVMFDGVCNLCNGTVQFLIKRDPSSKFRFASLQSNFAQQQLNRFNIDGTVMNTIVVVDHNKVYRKSDAVLKIVSRLGGLWQALIVFKILPRFLRDYVYDFVASHRYQYFGRRDSCMIPSKELNDRFVG